MLDVARNKASAEGLHVTWVEDDMSDFELGRRFGLAIIPYRSFLHLLTDEAQRGCLAGAFRHLEPGGRLALNFFPPPLALPKDASTLSRIHRHMRLRYVSKEEMESLLVAGGFQIEAVYGGFNHEPLTRNSSELVWVARRPD